MLSLAIVLTAACGVREQTAQITNDGERRLPLILVLRGRAWEMQGSRSAPCLYPRRRGESTRSSIDIVVQVVG